MCLARGVGGGWLGMLLKVRPWYGFYLTVLESENGLECKVKDL